MFLWYIDPGTGFTIFGIGSWLIVFLFGFFGLFSLFFKKIFNFFKRHKKLLMAIIIILLLIIFALAKKGVMMDRQVSKFDKKIIILGFDALSPKIIEPMMKEGGLPNFSRLKEMGSFKHISTTNPSQSPVAWSSFATGKNPAKTGIFDFIVRDPKTYKLDLSLTKMDRGKPRKVMKAKSFWLYSSEAGVPAVIISCPVTFPPDKIYGRMLSGMGVPDILGTEGTFTFYTTESLDRDKYIGGKVFHVNKNPVMAMHLLGPRIAKIGAKAENAKVPFKVVLKDKEGVIVEYQRHKTELKIGQWSDWNEVVFDLGFLRKIKGIFKFYLVEAEPELNLYISPINFDPREPFFKISYPGNYSKELADALGLYHTQGMPLDTWAVNEKRLSAGVFLQQANEILKEEKSKLDFELRRLEKGILFCYFESPDIIQHMFWQYIDTQHPLYDKNAPLEFKEAIYKWYKYLDDILGEVLKNINEADTLIVLSDHGFGSFRRAVHINSWLKENGYLELKNSYCPEGRELLVDIDWSKTKAYAIGFGAIYINQKNREIEGIVEPGGQTEILKEEIAKKLTKWIDEKYNQPVINKVYKREDIFWGDYVHSTPDIYIGFNIGYRASWQTALGAVPESLIEDNLKAWSGDHLFDPALVPGVIFSNKKITKESPSLYDITPTILKLIGFDDSKLKENNFDGEPLF